VPTKPSDPIRTTTASKKTSAGILRAVKSAGDAKSKGAAKSKSGAKAKSRSPASARAGRTASRTASRTTTAAHDKAVQRVSRSASLQRIVIDALDDMKALEVKVLDVRGVTDVADTMVIASGTSDRHVRSVAKNVVEKTKAAGFRPHGVEGQQDSDWVLIDLNEMIVHVMLPRTREFYGLEKLWDLTATKRAARS